MPERTDVVDELEATEAYLRDSAPALAVERLVLVVSGSLSAAFTPYWLNWLRMSHPGLRVRVVLTPGATRFVTPTAVAALVAEPVLVDEWPATTGVSRALHVELLEWAEAFVVLPASFSYLSRLASGSCDSPSTLALQCADVPVLITPGLPPGGLRSPAYRRHLEALAAYPNVRVVPPQPARSATTGRLDAASPAPLPDLLAHLAVARAS